MRRIIAVLLLAVTALSLSAAPKKTIYVSYILHGNMNYDRYVRPTIWKEFPVIYNNLLDFMDEHPDFAGQLQFSGQTISSLMICAPLVVQHAMDIHARGQLNFTGTFYSEPVNVNMDGETNYRCCWLGTKIVEDIIGEKTDGFYLQERAYHPQLPWIFNHADVSWTPVITGQDDFRPFKLKGMDGSESVCVPITRSGLLEKIATAPKNSLFTIEEDYEIPQSFASTYAKIAAFNAENKEGITVKWITVKDYIKKFGVDEARYVDHAAKAGNLENGTYSRWTADPLDIIVQDHTNRAMADIRSARIFSALLQDTLGVNVDVPFEDSGVNLIHDPLVWNIERAELYPGIEEKYLARNGKVTLLSKAENLLLWAVNSDAKGWYPLYEKRRERMNSFDNSSMLSRKVIYDGMDYLGSKVHVTPGYDAYYMVLNMEETRPVTLTIYTDRPASFFDCRDARHSEDMRFRSESVYIDGRYENRIEMEPAGYSYVTIGVKFHDKPDPEKWEEGRSISRNGISVSADGDGIRIDDHGKTIDLSMDSFQLKALAEMTGGKGDGEWRDAREYGQARISVRNGMIPQLRVERQIDWLIHVKQTFSIKDGKVWCDYDFEFPHPTLVRKEGGSRGTFDPRGLSLIVDTHNKGVFNYDIPYGISSYDGAGVSYQCPLSTGFLQHADGGVVVSPQTGEQAFSCDTDNGVITLYMGASTTSGPIRNVGLSYEGKTTVNHESEWYAEPFHGKYSHRIVIYSYDGDWRDVHVPESIREVSSPVYVREVHPSDSGDILSTGSYFNGNHQRNVNLTNAEVSDGQLILRFNEMEGRNTVYQPVVNGDLLKVELPPFGIKEIVKKVK